MYLKFEESWYYKWYSCKNFEEMGKFNCTNFLKTFQGKFKNSNFPDKLTFLYERASYSCYRKTFIFMPLRLQKRLQYTAGVDLTIWKMGKDVGSKRVWKGSINRFIFSLIDTLNNDLFSTKGMPMVLIETLLKVVTVI